MTSERWEIEKIINYTKKQANVREAYIACLEELIEKLREGREWTDENKVTKTYYNYVLPTLIFSEIDSNQPTRIKLTCFRDRREYRIWLKKEDE